ncbi:hypothetical protein F4212_13215 [Candidatus Poribacteria bacterium]|nr:hypothetical protein [Candidatus Poribacteria bacterium]
MGTIDFQWIWGGFGNCLYHRRGGVAPPVFTVFGYISGEETSPLRDDNVNAGEETAHGRELVN